MTGFGISQLSGDIRYSQFVARVRTLEDKLISHSQFVRLAESGNWENMINDLRNTEYGEILTNVHNYLQLKSVWAQIIEIKKKLFLELSLDPVVVDAIVSWYDFNNLKILIKHKLNDIQSDVSLSKSGKFNSDDLVSALKSDSSLPALLDDAYSFLRKDFEENKSLFRVEMLLEKFYLENLAEKFKNSSIIFLNYLITYYIDLIKINQVLRWRNFENQSDSSDIHNKKIDFELLPKEGFISNEILNELYNQGLENINSILAFTPYFGIYSDEVENTKGVPTKSGWVLEKMSDNFLTDFCSLTRYTPFGMEPLIAFIWYSFIELKNLKLILTSKFIGAEPKKIVARLRKCYA